MTSPILLAIVPQQGPTTGGNTVLLAGTGLTGATQVMFGTTAATAFTVLFDGAISATVPAGTGAVLVTVITGGGTSNPATYTYQEALPPTILALVPPIGLAVGGIPVLIAGSHLSGAIAVNFGTAPATNFTVLGDGAITAVSPPGSGTVQVTVVTGAGTSNGAAYTYL
ncbi:IPT/TIG domain-containing protein [Streptacidiphilus anmyonensis]|uniref:IPT/TIG domain-containing protein n=1 Tax=Streptacidiphilus anmyonensis TaxID=405782 RepID=UPI000693349B|nr:IPT/TIG domain-containing protein [Streptacidiphilus anmyonensis]